MATETEHAATQAAEAARRQKAAQPRGNTCTECGPTPCDDHDFTDIED